MSAMKEMAPHIRKTVAEIDGDIVQLTADADRLRGMRKGLIELYGGDTEVPDPEVKETGNPEPKKRRGGGQKRKGAERIAILRTLPEPFTAESFASAAGIDKRLAGIALCDYARAGYIERSAPGEYQRGRKFPLPE